MINFLWFFLIEAQVVWVNRLIVNWLWLIICKVSYSPGGNRIM